jgi:hypothetical protein
MAARRVRRAHDGRLWRPARVATTTRPTTGPARPHSRQPVAPAAAQHQARPGRRRSAAKAPPPALTPAQSGRPGCRSGAPLSRPQTRHPQAAARHQPQKPNAITTKGAGQQPATTDTYSTRRGPPVGPAVPAAAQMPGVLADAPASAQPRCARRPPSVAWVCVARPGRIAPTRSAGALPAARGRGRISPIQAASGEYDEGLWERQADGGIW